MKRMIPRLNANADTDTDADTNTSPSARNGYGRIV